MKNKKLIITLLVLGALVTVALLGGGMALAKSKKAYPPIVKKLVEKFDLDADEVNEVFEEAREERHKKMQARKKEKLDEAVEKGKITEEQKEALLEKMDELKQELGELKDLSPEERREAMKEHREEIRKWCEENDINLKDLKPGPNGKGMKGPRGFKGGGNCEGCEDGPCQ